MLLGLRVVPGFKLALGFKLMLGLWVMLGSEGCVQSCPVSKSVMVMPMMAERATRHSTKTS